MFQKAFVRSGIDIIFSEGFNPHPRMSIPLPRSVGVQSSGDKLVVRILGDRELFNKKDIESRIADQLPEGCQLVNVDLYDRKISCQPVSAEYAFSFKDSRKSYLKTVRLKGLIESGDPLMVEREVKGKLRSRDVGNFIESVENEGSTVVIKSSISNKGTIRPDEILILLELDRHDLSDPVMRRNISWKIK